MRNFILIVGLFFMLASCSSSRTAGNEKRKSQTTVPSGTTGSVIVVPGKKSSLPPGQAKKVYGTQSAKPFAPGQVKKSQQGLYPLILVMSPRMPLKQGKNGKMYYTNGSGAVYWLNSNNKLYLDKSFIPKANFTEKDWEDWDSRKNSL